MSTPAAHRALARLMPDFLGIGAMRAGTSWLATQLDRHPRVSIPRKEIHFFDRKIGRRILPFVDAGLEARLRYGLRFLGPRLRRRGRGPRRLTGEFTPAYATLEAATIRTIHEWMPEARILFIMRDPVERAWSQARHDYRAFLDRDVASASADELIAFLGREPVRRRGAYADCLEAWLRSYDRERIFCAFLEDVADDPARVLAEVFGFLGVPESEAPAVGVGRPIHAGAPAAMPARVRAYLEETLRPGDERLERLLGRSLPWRGSGLS